MRIILLRGVVLLIGIVASGAIPYSLRSAPFSLQMFVPFCGIPAVVAFSVFVCGLAWQKLSLFRTAILGFGMCMTVLIILTISFARTESDMSQTFIMTIFFSIYCLPAVLAGSCASKIHRTVPFTKGTG